MLAERKMRVQVFKADRPKQKMKVGEIDLALSTIERIEHLWSNYQNGTNGDPGTAMADIAMIKSILTKERRMREWVFRKALKKKRAKVGEIDLALDTLSLIEKTWGEFQLDLFTTGDGNDLP